jgi:hypothetical protein
MFALGMLMSLARREPSAVAALAARGPNIFRRALHKTADVLHLSRDRSGERSRGGR